jgi:hypothetical protein
MDAVPRFVDEIAAAGEGTVPANLRDMIEAALVLARLRRRVARGASY